MRVQAGNSSSAEHTLAWKGSVIRKLEEVKSEKIIPSRPTGSFFMFLQKKINEKLKVCQ